MGGSMSEVAALLDALRQQGIELKVEGSKLLFRPLSGYPRS